MAIGRITTSMLHNTNNLSHLSGFNRQRNVPAGGQGLNLNEILRSAATFVTTGANRATQLRNTITSLPAIMDRLNAVSGNPAALRIESFTGTNIPETNVRIDQIATNQRNVGTSLPANSNVMEPGSFTIEVEVDGNTRLISFSTSETMTNRAFQNRMAQAINNANIGVTASVSTVNNQSSLTVSTRETGSSEDDEPRFTIRDITGNAVERTGVGEMTYAGQDAIFYVNDGEQRTSSSNTVNLGGGLSVTLLASPDVAVAITEGRDEEGIRSAVRQVVSQINGLLESARDNQIDRRTRAVVRELESVIRRNRRHLSDIGVNMAQSGFLTLDDDALRSAVSKGTTDTLFRPQGRMQSSFLTSLTRIADRVSENPTWHISQHTARLPEFNSILAQVRSNSNQAQLQQQQQTLNSALDVNSLINSLFGS